MWYHTNAQKKIITIGCLGLILHKKDTVTNLPKPRKGFWEGGIYYIL
jgi:hypothetical protein